MERTLAERNGVKTMQVNKDGPHYIWLQLTVTWIRSDSSWIMGQTLINLMK